MNGPNNIQLEKFAPPTPDEFFGTLFGIVGSLVEVPLRMGDGARSAVQGAVSEFKAFPRRP